jgi:3-hydroxybutyryl-CoA dehydrogenase
MGAGIAQAFCQRGFSVHLYSRQRSRLDAALALIKSRQEELIRNGGMRRQTADRALTLVKATTSLENAIRDADLVSENIAEKLSAKKALYRELGALPATVILATNTSSLPLTALSSAVRHPERFVGMHWMNPAHLMPIVEIIRAPATSDATVRTTCEITRRAGKSPILLNRDIPGFVVNRLQYALFREAFFLVQEGVIDPAGIDEAIKDGLGLRWAVSGPFEHMDLSGLNLVESVATSLFKQLDRASVSPPMLRALVDGGELGLKTGGGVLGLAQTHLERLATRRDDNLIALLRSLRRLKRSVTA